MYHLLGLCLVALTQSSLLHTGQCLLDLVAASGQHGFLVLVRLRFQLLQERLQDTQKLRESDILTMSVSAWER